MVGGGVGRSAWEALMTAGQTIRIVPSIERHAAQRLNERYGLAFTIELKSEIFRQIEAARANDNRHPLACCIAADDRGERWIVSVGGHVLVLAVNAQSNTIATFLPSKGKRP